MELLFVILVGLVMAVGPFLLFLVGLWLTMMVICGTIKAFFP